MINIQPIEKRAVHDGTFLEVHSIFYTIQGEGPFAGSPAVFVRLAGCNLRCPSCDTDYTEGRQILRIDDIFYRVENAHNKAMTNKLVVITGGEPFRQNIGKLVEHLECAGYTVQIETNGTMPPPANFSESVFVVCSPKAGKVNKGLLPFISAYKYVMTAGSVDPDDGLPILALDHTAVPCVARPHDGFKGPVYLQPADMQHGARNAVNKIAAVQSCLKFGYIFQLQIHKIIGVA